MWFWPQSDRTLLVRIKSSPSNINLIVAYSLTAESSDDEIEKFYDDLEEVYKQCRSDEVNIVMGDFNAKVGCKSNGKTVGPFGLRDKNERGERLIHWCEEKRLAVMNTWLDVHPRNRYTWISPGDRARNQIDYILISKRYRSAVSKVRTYPGADANSDHEPVVATIKLHLKRIRTTKQIPKFNLNSLKESYR